MPFFPRPNDPKPSINDQRSVPGKDNILTDTKRGIDPTPAHDVARSMPPPSEPTGSKLVPRSKSSPSRESPILSQEQQQNQQERAPNINSQAENKKIDGHDVLARTPSQDQQPKNFDGLKEQSRIERKEAAGHVLALIPSKDHQQSKNYAGRIETSVVPVKEQYPSKPPKQEDGDNKGPRHGTTTEYHHVSEKADMPKDQAPTLPQEHRPKDNVGVTNPPADPPVNNYPNININVYVSTDQPKSVDKINDAIKENNVKPANNLDKKTDAESSFCERCKKLCSIL